MRPPKSNYELSSSQVATPPSVVDFYWRVMRSHRESLPRVVDLGAGDARFAKGGHFRQYLGIEIDPVVAKRAVLPRNAEMRVGCAFASNDDDFDGCIGNPPYVRHHYVASPWKEKTLEMLNQSLRGALDGHGNLYLYFIALGLIKTKATGIVGVVVPFEWVSRPSSRGIRAVIDREGWNVSVYRFQKAIFNGVITTASISIIDKAERDGTWNFFDVSEQFAIAPQQGPIRGKSAALPHKKRGSVFAQRGLSPGSQKIFTLTEGERIHHGLHLMDVVPCVTSLKGLPDSLRKLNKSAFKTYFVDAGRRCWLIKSNRGTLSDRLRTYLDGIPAVARNTWTCKTQEPWYNYETPRVPKLLLLSGFISHGPRILRNHIRAVNVGSVYGLFFSDHVPITRLHKHLLNFDVESRVVPHAKTLKKIEVGQLNGLLEEWWHANRAR